MAPALASWRGHEYPLEARLTNNDPNLAALTVPELKTLLRAWDVEPHLIVSAPTKKGLIALVPDGVSSFDVPDEWQLEVLREENARARTKSITAATTLAGIIGTGGEKLGAPSSSAHVHAQQETPSSHHSNGGHAATSRTADCVKPRSARRPRTKRGGSGPKPPPCAALKTR